MPQHLCCDNCASACTCGTSECGQLITFPYTEELKKNMKPVKTRTVSNKQQNSIKQTAKQYFDST